MSATLASAFGVSLPLGLRRYGQRWDDLAIDFQQPLRPQLETDLLAVCIRDAQGHSLDPEFFWRWGVSDRTAGLLSLVALEIGPTLPLTLACPQENCQQVMEVAIALDALHQLQPEAAPEVATVSLGEQQLQVRRPTGQDQLTWLTQTTQGDPPDLRTMLQSLIQTPNSAEQANPLPPDLTPALPALNQALDDLDPLVNFSLAVTCPHCGQPSQPEIDLGAWALKILQRVQQRLIETVHRLACRYHWTEAEILALPEWRRDRYLALIDREVR
ncbi:hypothetical protein [Phormidium tenue]|uniref:Uncharacterized protein n=1 Tax=Phormidium tenue NIES-30 TaxID=549789 RepID=A0A1U7IYK0_9CYAN|nr:hypothetical protein [Phormidium tenue]MBD2232774.1 hypothetical protein [Phormidium tenue FACHB-1052]OKH43710.1 hypothetical protein NIES30_24470 [Phormidium tenue NIES-30]